VCHRVESGYINAHNDTYARTTWNGSTQLREDGYIYTLCVYTIYNRDCGGPTPPHWSTVFRHTFWVSPFCAHACRVMLYMMSLVSCQRSKQSKVFTKSVAGKCRRAGDILWRSCVVKCQAWFIVSWRTLHILYICISEHGHSHRVLNCFSAESCFKRQTWCIFMWYEISFIYDMSDRQVVWWLYRSMFAEVCLGW